MLSQVRCVCRTFGGRSQLLGVLFGSLSRLLCLPMCGCRIGHAGFEVR